MRRTIILLSLIVALATAVDIFSSVLGPGAIVRHADGSTSPFPDHGMTLAPGTSVELTAAPTGMAQRNLVQITKSAGSKLLLDLEGETVVLDDASPQCHPGANPGEVRCSVPWDRRSMDEVSVSVAGEGAGEATIRDIGVQYLVAKRVTSLQDAPLLPLFLVIVGGIPLVWLTHRNTVLSQWVIIGIAATALSMVQPVFTAVLAVFLLGMYQAGRWMASQRKRSLGVLASLLLGALGFLALFKFAIPILAGVFANPGGFYLILPLGLSYFVIRLIDTQLSWYRGQLGDVSIREYLCHQVFPPTVASGPIESIKSFRAGRLGHITGDDVGYGVTRLSIGLVKKVLVADIVLASVIDQNLFAVASDPSGVEASKIALLLVGNFLFAYIDFSAYCDIAIGLGRLYGQRVSENFNFPILRESLRRYWQNWHMTLSQWAQRNVYMVVAMETRNAYIPIFATMLAIGLWHEFGIPWTLWAIHHSVGLAFLTFLDQKRWTVTHRLWYSAAVPVRIMATVGFVALGHAFVLFHDPLLALTVYGRGWALPLNFVLFP